MLGVRCSAGTRSARAAQRSVPGRSSRLVPSRWRRSKKYGVTWTPLVHGRAGRGLLERSGPAVLGQGERLAVQDQPVGRERPHHLDHLGQPVGDHVERPGGDDDVVAVLVHLDADAVELGVDGDQPAGLGHRGGHVGRAGGEHRQHRPADLETDLGQGGLALERRPRDGHRAAREHRRAAYGLERRPRGGGQTFLDQRVEGALADVAGDHAAQPGLLVGGRPGQQVLHRGLAGGLGAGPGQAGQVVERRVHLGDRQARLVRGRRRRADPAPADAGTPLEQRSRRGRRRPPRGPRRPPRPASPPAPPPWPCATGWPRRSARSPRSGRAARGHSCPWARRQASRRRCASAPRTARGRTSGPARGGGSRRRTSRRCRTCGRWSAAPPGGAGTATPGSCPRGRRAPRTSRTRPSAPPGAAYTDAKVSTSSGDSR